MKRQLEKMYGTPVSISLDSMKYWHPTDEDYSSKKEKYFHSSVTLFGNISVKELNS